MNDQNPYLASQAPSQSHPSGIPPEERQWAMFSHLSAFSTFIIPLGNIVGPLIMYLIKKDQYRFGSDQAREALNFNISCLIYGIVSAFLCLVFIGFLLLPAVFIFWFVCTIIATIKSNEGQFYRYPLNIRMVS